MSRGASARRTAGEAAKAARSNPYVQRLLTDEELRANLRDAVDAARHAYSRMSNGKGPAKAIMEDKKVQKDLRNAADSLKEASDQLRTGGRRKKRRGRLLAVGLLGVGFVLVASEGARKTVLDKLFGAEEEFEYTSTTSASPTDQTPAA